MSGAEKSRLFPDNERIAKAALDLEIAKLKKNNPQVDNQELQWRLDLLPEQTSEGLIRLKESVGFVLREELRQAKRVAEGEIPRLVDKMSFDMIAHLMIYGRSKPN